MFFYNLNHSWKGNQPDEGDTYQGVILNPSAFERSSGMRRALEGKVNAEIFLFDPQLYLLDLQFPAGVFPTFAKNLGTYPWIGIEPPDFDSGQLRQFVEGEEELPVEARWKERKDPLSQWDVTVREAVNHQVNMGCDAIILPAPLIQDPETNLERDFDLLERAIQIATPLRGEKPLYASVPLADGLLAHHDFLENPLIEAIPDTLSAMAGLTGVYIPFLQVSATEQERVASQNGPGSLMRLARRFGSRTDLKTIFNFTESLGIVLHALGAQGYASGYNRKQRRLHISDFIPKKGGGGAFPKFYSMELCTDFLPSRGMERIAKKRLLSPMMRDVTNSSRPLFEALKAKKSVNDSVPDWAEIPGNIAAARHHYFEQHSRSHERVPDAEAAIAWLQDAEKNWAYLQQRFSGDPGGPLEATANHLEPWRTALDRLMEAEPMD